MHMYTSVVLQTRGMLRRVGRHQQLYISDVEPGHFHDLICQKGMTSDIFLTLRYNIN